MITKDLGMVTAYAYAVSKGYTGTEEEFAELMASYASVAQEAVDAALAAAQSAQNAQDAKTAAEGARDTAQNTVSGAIAGIQAEGQIQIGAVQSEGTTQVGNVNSAGQTQVGNVNAAGTTQVGNVNTAGSTQVNAVQAKGEEVLNSIPSDYTELSDDVTDLKSAIDEVERVAGREGMTFTLANTSNVSRQFECRFFAGHRYTITNNTNGTITFQTRLTQSGSTVDDIGNIPANSSTDFICSTDAYWFNSWCPNIGSIVIDDESTINIQIQDGLSLLSEQRREFNVVADVISNLFDGNFALGYAILSNGKFNTATNTVTAIIPCEPNTTYFIKSIGAHNRWIIATSDNALPIGQTVDVITPASPNLTNCWEVHTGATAKYLFVYVSNQNETPSLCITKKEIYNIVSYNSPINADLSAEVSHNLSAHIIKALSSEYLINLFDGNYINDIGLLALGTVPADGLYTNVNGSRTIIVPVKPNTTYYFRSFDAHNRIRYGTSNKFPTVGDTVYIYSSQGITGNYNFSYTTNSSESWLIVTVTNQSDEPRVQITEDVDFATFIGYNSIKPKNDEFGNSTKWYFLDDITGIFGADTTISALDADTTRIDDIYSIYDALVANHSDYVSKTVLGTVSTENLEMRKYTFNSLSVQNNSAYSLKKPKLIFIAGIHGYEQGSSYCLAKVMEQLTNGTDSISKFIRNNIEIIIVPVANPYGYNHNRRKNENGVDLNRNFEAGWSSTGSPSDDYYGGASANSEAETQILTTLLDDNDDAYYAVDFHNIANGYPLMYLYTNKQTQFCNSLFVTLTNKWLSEYTGFPTNRLLGYCNTGVNACFAKQALSIGINSFVAEAPWIMPVIGSSQYDVPTLTIGVDVFGNIVAMLAKSMV